MLKLADELDVVDELRAGFRNTIVMSIGPTTSEMLRNEDLPVDMEPSHPKMGHLVIEAAERAPELLARKRMIAKQVTGLALPALARKHFSDRQLNEQVRNPQSAIRNSVFLSACRREPTPYTPVWLMRQAGRYMPEYRQIRAEHSFLELCRNP